MDDSTTTLDILPAHARKNRPVFPCYMDKDGSKEPYTKNGFYAATCDEKTIREWWTRWSDALIGMPTGPKSGVIVIDVDVKKGRDGEATQADLQKQHGPLPDTVEALITTGGRHLYFRYPEGVSIRNTASRIGDGLDVRGEGGYVILPGSRVNGHWYEWEGLSDPDEGVRAAEAPQTLAGQPREKPASEAEPPNSQHHVCRLRMAPIRSILGTVGTGAGRNAHNNRSRFHLATPRPPAAFARAHGLCR